MKRIFILWLSVALLYDLSAQTSKKEITLEDIWSNSTFASKSVGGVESMKDGDHYTTLEKVKDESVIVQYEYKSGKAVDTLLKQSWIKLSEDVKKKLPDAKLDFSGYSFSADESLILIHADDERIYRHSAVSQYYIFNRKNKSTIPLSTGGKQMYATFAPDSARVAFVRENNLFLFDMLKGKEIPITVDGKKNEIINGASDWVYEEELELIQAFFWSPDGRRIAYYRFDESKVKEYSLDEYGTGSYPKKDTFKYPKAGEANSIVTINIYDIVKGVNFKIPEFREGTITNQYIPRIKWAHEPWILAVQRMTRKQDELELLLTDARTGQSKVIMTETSSTYIEITDNLTFLDDNKHFIWSSEKDGFNHLYLYNISGALENQITTGKFDVTKLYGVDGNTIYFQSAETSPLERYIYSIKTDGGGKKQLGSRKGTNTGEFSSNYKYFINYNSSANTPPFISLNSGSDGKEIRVLEDNAKLSSKMGEYSLGKKEFFKFKTGEWIELNGWIMKPADFSESKKYPVLMTVYGGPGINIVNDAWDGKNYLWYQMLCQKGYVIVAVDGRGTGFRGEEFKKCTQKNLGKLETIDQIETAKYLGGLSYVDKTRIGIWGWSYGGYETTLCMLKGADFFKAGIAVAPLAHWKFYDSIYAERFMGAPKDNPWGYEESSPLTYAEKLKGKFLLIHGTSDDNVHIQNSMEIVNAFVKEGKQFETFFYPNKNHSIHGGNTRLHLYRKMTDFILMNL